MREKDHSNTESSPIKLLVLQSTPFCNINCDYCYLPNRLSKRTLSFDLLERVFQNLLASRLLGRQLTVVWHAGEPLIMPISFYESAIQKIHRLNTKDCRISHAIQTNGILLNQAWCDFIKKHHINIGVSIDGPAFIHDAHRKTRSGKGTHAATMEGISFLRSNEIEFHVIAVITQQSLNFPDEIFNFFVKNNIKMVGFNVEEVEGINTLSSLQKKGTDKRYRMFMDRIYELTKSTPDAVVIREFAHVTNFILQEAHITQSEQVTPFSIVSVDCDGNFTTFSPELLGMQSPVYGDFVLGNVWNNTFESIYTTEKFHRMYQDIQAGVALCQNTCEYFALCGGGAPANKYFENGTLRSSETMYCRYVIQTPVDIVLEDLERKALGTRILPSPSGSEDAR